MKKAISPVIAVVILISFSVVLGVAVFLWMKGGVFSFGQTSSVNEKCKSLNFFVGDVCYEESLGKIQIEFTARNNGDDDISAFALSLEYEGGKETVDLDIELKFQESKTIQSSFIEEKFNMKRISIIPKIETGQGRFLCSEKEKVIAWSEIDKCA